MLSCRSKVISSINLFSTRACSKQRDNHLLKIVESLTQPLHKDSDIDEDDFSELGEQVVKEEKSFLKLMTEKPDPYLRSGPIKIPSSGLSLPADRRLNSKNAHRSSVDYKNILNSKNSNTITIKSIPSVVSLCQLKQELSDFGSVSHASMRVEQDGLICCNVKFETPESFMRAISVGGVTVKGFHLAISPQYGQEAVMIRISNISSETSDSTIHSICKSYGPLEGLVRTKADVVDALFGVQDNSKMQSLLKKLNYTFKNDQKWSAHLHPVDSIPAVVNDSDTPGLSMSRHFDELKSQVSMKMVCVEDLEHLLNSLEHLEAHPDTIRD